MDLVAKELTNDVLVSSPNRVTVTLAEIEADGGKSEQDSAEWWSEEDKAAYDAWLAETGKEGTGADFFEY